jgi:predicted alpha/beta hydrolase
MTTAVPPKPDAAARDAVVSLRVEVDRGAAIEMRFYAPPAGTPPAAAVLVGAAMGVRQAFYRPFAESVRFPLVAVSIGDDEMMTERGIRVLVDCYANAPRRVERVSPADLAVRRIGHFGFFRDSFESTLWARAQSWLNEFQLAKETR